MEFALQTALNGFSTGAIYGLIAAGFSLTYLATRRFNFGLGMWVMLGAMLSYTLVVQIELPPLAALPLVVGISLVLGLAAEHISVRPFQSSKNDLWIVATLAVGLMLVDAAQLIWGKFPLAVDDYLGTEPWTVGGIRIRTQHVLTFTAVIAVFLAMHAFFRHSLSGAEYRAVAKDRVMAELMGINTRRAEQLAFGAAAALAGLAGFLVSPITGAEANIGTALGFKGFAVAIVGGLAAPRGVLIVGLSYGVLEALVSAYLFTGIRDILSFSIMIISLYILPFGIFGEPERERR